jgi:hypothetical protein
MRAKKTTNQSSVPRDDFIDEEGVLCLRGSLFWKWRALDAELKSVTIEIEQTQTRISMEIAKNKELSDLMSHRSALAGQVSVAKTELANVQTEIEALMGISLKDCAFDDKTGRLYNLSPDGTRGEPATPPVKQTKRRVRKVTQPQ